jgi:hypothetical protein
VLTGVVVSINVLVIILIFFFFWRFFSGKQQSQSSGSAGAEDDDALPVASPWAVRRHRRSNAPRPQPQVDVSASLPVYAHSSAGAGGKAVECAVCIVELKDGDAARQLPRCGHRFHADCIGAWLRLHATCPICRATVVAPVAAAATTEPVNAKDAAFGAGCPV